LANLEGTPTNLNILSSVSFQFFIRRAPDVNFHITRVDVPGVELGIANQPTPFSDLPHPGEHMQWSELDLDFLVDEDANGYLEIFNWLTALGRPNSGYNFGQLEEEPAATNLGIYSDLSLLIMDSKRNLNLQCDFLDAFPVALGAMVFDSQETDLTFMPINCRFKYQRFDIYKVGGSPTP